MGKILAVVFATAMILAGCQSNEDANVVGTYEVGRHEGEYTIENAVQTVDGAVVSIINKQPITIPFVPYSGDQSLEVAGTGSGVVYKISDGNAYVVTNNHVVDGAQELTVQYKDGDASKAEVLGVDNYTDLAVLKTTSEHASKIALFGDSDALTVGEPAIAIGSPLGTEFASSVTSGVISGLNRSVPVDVNGDGEMDWESESIQTDAAINPGNSGGALINIAGQVVGINSMKLTSTSVEGMGFAIPSNNVVQIVDQLERDGKVTRPYLGVQMADLALFDEGELNLPEDVDRGSVLVFVADFSPADRAGLEANDVIVKFGDEKIKNSDALRQAIYFSRVNEAIDVSYYRDGELMTTTVTMRAQQTNL